MFRATGLKRPGCPEMLALRPLPQPDAGKHASGRGRGRRAAVFFSPWYEAEQSAPFCSASCPNREAAPPVYAGGAGERYGGRAGVRAPVLFAGRKGRVAFPGCGVRFLTRRNEKPALRANFLTRRGRPVTRCCAQGRAGALEKACGAQRAAPPGGCLPQPATGKACVAGIPTLPDGRKIGFFLSYPLGLHYLCPHERKTNCTESWRKDIGVARNVGHVFARLHRSSRA